MAKHCWWASSHWFFPIHHCGFEIWSRLKIMVVLPTQKKCSSHDFWPDFTICVWPKASVHWNRPLSWVSKRRRVWGRFWRQKVEHVSLRARKKRKRLCSYFLPIMGIWPSNNQPTKHDDPTAQVIQKKDEQYARCIDSSNQSIADQPMHSHVQC